MLDFYPITSGSLSVKENSDSIIGYDSENKRWIELNKSSEDLLLLCNGDHSVRDIIFRLSELYDCLNSESRRKALSILESLQNDGVIDFKREPHPTPIRFRKYDFDWPLQAVFIEVTNKCNLECKHCYNHSSPNGWGGLNRQELFSFLDEIDELGVFQVYFTGGEPFFRQDFHEIVEHVHIKGIDIGILTNATLIDSSDLDLLYEINPRFVAVSLDSIDDRKYREIRGISNRRVIENISKLKGKGISVRINTVLFRGLNDSYEDLINLLTFLKTNGFTEKDVAIDEFLQIGRGSGLAGYCLDQNDISLNIKRAFREIYDYEYSIKPNYADNEESNKNSFCGIGESIFYLNSKGDITLCTVLNDKRFKVGSIFEQSVRDVWEKSELFEYFREKRHITLTECERCSRLCDCNGGCKAKSMLLSGAFDKPDYWMCRIFGK